MANNCTSSDNDNNRHGNCNTARNRTMRYPPYQPSSNGSTPACADHGTTVFTSPSSLVSTFPPRAGRRRRQRVAELLQQLHE
ncbi:hypothetical protein ColKHC_11272 [Colletotrichum higginsianum]|nr:hypothetical protein ColKHC_11272 [Colletotrichum higginsianum]